MQSFLVRLKPTELGSDIYVATVINPDAHPEHPIVLPPDLPGEPPVLPPVEVKFRWLPTEGGWVGMYGPLDKPAPLPPGFEDSQGKWVMTGFGVFFVVGPYDKPRPPGSVIDPDPPVDPGDPPDDVEGRWVYTDQGWVWVLGPFAGGKPQPLP